MIVDPEFELVLSASPLDNPRRLVYADWLEEHGEVEYSAWQRRVVESRLVPIPRLIHMYVTGAQLWRWPYVYLHGKAEIINGDDRFIASVPMPEKPGEYPVLLRSHPCWAVLSFRSRRYGSPLAHEWICGRVAMVDDPVALVHVRNPIDWR